MGRYATKVCHECGIRRPINLMTSQIEKVRSGNIGWGLSFNPSRKKSLRVQLPRNRYSRRTVYYCKDRAAHHVLDYYGMSQSKIIKSETRPKIIAPPARERRPLQTTNNSTIKEETLTTNISPKPLSNLEFVVPESETISEAVSYFNKKYKIKIDKLNLDKENNQQLDIAKSSEEDSKKSQKKIEKDVAESDDDPKQKYFDLYYAEDFFDKCCIILGFKIANADGNVQEIEFTNFVKNFMENKTITETDIHEIWEMANNYSDKNVISLLNRKYNTNKDAFEDLIVNLLFIAEADGEIVPEEYNKIKDYALKLSLTPEQFDNLYKRFEPSEITNDQTIYDIDDIDEIADLIDLDDE